MTRIVRLGVWVAAALLLSPGTLTASQKRKKKDVDFTQTLALPAEPPAWVAADPARLSFRVTPLGARGLLSQQVRDALKALLGSSGGAQVVRLRAFVAGAGDLRRVTQIVGDVFGDRHMALPVLTVVQVGALPLEGAQVQFEATLQEKRPRKEPALVLAEAEGASPRAALEQLNLVLSRAGAAGSAVLTATCAVPALDGTADVRAVLAPRLFPQAHMLWLQPQRSPAGSLSACQAVARMGAAPPGVRTGEGFRVVSAASLVFTGAQLAFRYQESDARLAFERLEKTLRAAGVSWPQVLCLNVYPLSVQLSELARQVRGRFVDPARPPLGFLVPFEGLPSMDASFSLEAVAVSVSSSQ